jgi:serine/threonine-protein kinase
MSLAAGSRLGPYQITEPIGSGGMGEVYRARDVRLGRQVAVKVLPDRLAGDPQALIRFEREARAVAALSHPNVLALYDFGEYDGNVCAVTELLEGESLDRRIAREKITWRQAAEIAAAIADGLSAAHARGIVHRDLKPTNVFVTRDGLVKVIDFGLARPEAPGVAAPGDPTTRLANTQPGTVLGTIGYMSPEQVRGEEIDARSDVFSLGCVLYEMLTGQQAFRGGTSAETLAAILRDQPTELTGASTAIPSNIEPVVRRCLETDRNHRFQSASDLAFALRALSTGSTNIPAAVPVRWNWRRIAAVAAGLLAAVVAIPLAWEPLTSWLGPTRVTSIAVLPFVNGSGDPAQEFVADGVTEQLIADLARIPALRVVSRTSAMSYKGSRRPLREIAQELDVTDVVEGSVTRVGTRVAVTTDLIKVSTETHVWSDRYEREMRDVLSLQREIAEQVARKVAARLSPEDLHRLQNRRQIDPEAFESYVRGRYYWNKRGEADLNRAVEEFSHAIDVDPTYAAAYAGLADAYSQMGYLGTLSFRDAFPKAKAAANRALELDADSGEPHASLGFIHLYFDWDFAGAEREFKRAIALDPNTVTARHSYSILLTAMLRPEEARQQIEAARGLDPFSVVVSTDMGFQKYYERQYPEAITSLQEAIKRYPQAPLPHFWLARTYQAQGRFDEALAEFQRGGPALTSLPALLSGLGHFYGISGRRADALKVLETMDAMASRRFVTAYARALVYLGLGDRNQTLEWLQRAYDERSVWMVWLLKDPRWDPMRGDQRFEAIVDRVGFPRDARARSPKPTTRDDNLRTRG